MDYSESFLVLLRVLMGSVLSIFFNAMVENTQLHLWTFLSWNIYGCIQAHSNGRKYWSWNGHVYSTWRILLTSSKILGNIFKPLLTRMTLTLIGWHHWIILFLNREIIVSYVWKYNFLFDCSSLMQNMHSLPCNSMIWWINWSIIR